MMIMGYPCKNEKNLMNERGDKKMMMMRMSAERGKIE
jgi:hypothetical protein